MLEKDLDDGPVEDEQARRRRPGDQKNELQGKGESPFHPRHIFAGGLFRKSGEQGDGESDRKNAERELLDLEGDVPEVLEWIKGFFP